MKRSTFLKTTGLFTLGGIVMNDFKSLANSVSTWEDTDRIMPALFVGHGAPLYVLGENQYIWLLCFQHLKSCTCVRLLRLVLLHFYRLIDRKYPYCFHVTIDKPNDIR